MFCLSVSYKKTPLPIRQKFSFSIEEQNLLLSDLITKKQITGGVVVSTCNRSEIYFTGAKKAVASVEHALAAFKRLEEKDIKKYCLAYGGKSAVRHLFKVTCGLDSMVLGEDEILRQVKEAYLSAAESAYTDSELNITFQGALNCAKQAKSTTKLSTTPVSIGTLTANETERYLKTEAARENQESLVLVVGATGKIGRIVAKDLIAKGITVIGTSRSHHPGTEETFAEMHGIRFVDFHDRYAYINQADAVISATASPHYILTAEDYEEKITEKKPRLLIDLAVPYDIDPAIEKMDLVQLRDIDYFTALSKENNQIKRGELKKASQLLEECVEDTLKKVYIRDFRTETEQKQKEEWFRKMLYYLKETLDSEQLKAVLEKISETEKGDA